MKVYIVFRYDDVEAVFSTEEAAQALAEKRNGQIKEYREPGTGKYAYWNGFDRLCKCGHTLGVHVAGGFDCLNGEKGVPNATGVPCDCMKFRPSRRKAKK